MNDITWIDHGEMVLNDWKVMEFKPLQNNSSLVKRKDEKFFIHDTQYLKSENIIQLKDASKRLDNHRYHDKSIYIMGVYIVEKQNRKKLVESL